MSTPKITDVELVDDYINGNEQALELLITRHKKRIFSYICKIIRNEDISNDIFQETFIKVIHTLKSKKYNEEGKFLPWVIRIAHNLCIDYIRKEKKKNTRPNTGEFDIFDFIPEESKNVEEQFIDMHISSEVQKLLDYLPDDQKEVIIMRHYSGLSFKEIAEETDVSINTALGRMRYALINLRKVIEEKNLSLTYY